MLYSKACSVSFYIWEQTHLCKENSLCVLSREINLILTGIPQSSGWKEKLTTGFTTEKAESVEKATENVKDIREMMSQIIKSECGECDGANCEYVKPRTKLACCGLPDPGERPWITASHGTHFPEVGFTNTYYNLTGIMKILWRW